MAVKPYDNGNNNDGTTTETLHEHKLSALVQKYRSRQQVNWSQQ